MHAIMYDQVSPKHLAIWTFHAFGSISIIIFLEIDFFKLLNRMFHHRQSSNRKIALELFVIRTFSWHLRKASTIRRFWQISTRNSPRLRYNSNFSEKVDIRIDKLMIFENFRE